jgi:Glycosyl transferase family 2
MVGKAPIVLFAFNRPEHTRRTLSALKNNHLADSSLLFIYIDGPKADFTEDQIRKINAVKEVAKEEQWCSEVKIIESKANKGLAGSVTEGVTEVVNKFGTVIVLEDDLVPDKWFLKFMNDALTVYENENEVVCVTGYIYPVNKPLPNNFFLKGTDCWGWATWTRGWDIFEHDGNKLLTELEMRNLTFDFDFFNSYPFVQMLKDQIAKKNNSWSILWCTSAYLKNKYTLYPGHSLIHNIGFDGTGTHGGTTAAFDVKLLHEELKVEKLNIDENKEAKTIIAEYFRNMHQNRGPRFIPTIINRLSRFSVPSTFLLNGGLRPSFPQKRPK